MLLLRAPFFSIAHIYSNLICLDASTRVIQMLPISTDCQGCPLNYASLANEIWLINVPVSPKFGSENELSLLQRNEDFLASATGKNLSKIDEDIRRKGFKHSI